MALDNLAKRLLSDGPTCYNCNMFNKENKTCDRIYGNEDPLPETLHCDKWVKEYLVTTGARKLKVNWPQQTEQDLKAYHGLDVEKELAKSIKNSGMWNWEDYVGKTGIVYNSDEEQG